MGASRSYRRVLGEGKSRFTFALILTKASKFAFFLKSLPGGWQDAKNANFEKSLTKQKVPYAKAAPQDELEVLLAFSDIEIR